MSRTTFWLGSFGPALVYASLIAAFDLASRMGAFGSLIIALLIIWVALATGAKRCHDRNRSGWFQSIALVPFPGLIWLLVELGFMKGTRRRQSVRSGACLIALYSRQ